MVSLFIKHVLGVGANHPGMYGETLAYYGTVEQQGHLTLHLHILIWILGCLTPQEIRRRILDPSSDFQRKIVEYLESTHVGEFLTGKQDDVLEHIKKTSQSPEYLDPTQTMPEMPPKPCLAMCDKCHRCKVLSLWNDKFK